MFFVHFALTCLILLGNSFGNLKMVSTRKQRRQNTGLLGHLSESDTDFTIGHNNYETYTENRANMADGNITLNKASNLTQVRSSQEDMHTLKKSIAIKVHSGADSVMTTVETRVQDAVSTAI